MVVAERLDASNWRGSRVVNVALKKAAATVRPGGPPAPSPIRDRDPLGRLTAKQHPQVCSVALQCAP